MNSIINQVLGYVGKANNALRISTVNNSVDQFDSSTGVRHYVVKIFQILSVVLLAVMIVNCTNLFVQYVGAEHTTLEKIASFLSYLVCLYAAFPLAQIIRSRGESLGGAHNGMFSFIFHDAAKAGIRLIGELSAIILLTHAVCLFIALVFKASVFEYCDTGYALTGIGSAVSDLLTAITGFASSTLQSIGLNVDLGSLFSVRTSSFNTTTAAGEWTKAGIVDVLQSLLNVLYTLIILYLTLAFYSFFYNLAATFIKWVSNPTVPISIKNR
jgi:hypothetical protein